MSKVTTACSNLASKIKSLLGFSEPEEGPLSDFHTYMPDMLELMAKGIRENEGTALDAVSDLAGDIAEQMQLDGSGFQGGALSGLSNILAAFSDMVTDSFSRLIDRLAALAGGMDFTARNVTAAGTSGAYIATPMLNRDSEWTDSLAEKVARKVSDGNRAGGSKQPIVLNVYVGDEKLVTKVIDGINMITDRTGSCPVHV